MANILDKMKNILVVLLIILANQSINAQTDYRSPVTEEHEPVASGKFEDSWDSLRKYEVPEWFRNAKFGIWAHWGPQCQPEQGDWYGRFMYVQGSRQYNWHVSHYGPPSKFGFKDVIHDWKAEKWDPSKLVELYKRAGAQYFFAMANHHDNLDLWDSKYQDWNSVRVGPHKDVIKGWADAAKKNNLPFGLSVHAAHAWLWYESAQQCDTAGAFADVPYDGKLTKDDGIGTWWEGLDPQDLYAQSHKASRDAENSSSVFNQWDWNNGASIPDQEYCQRFYDRTMDLINQYHPDLLYFDDTTLPLYPVSNAGLKLAAHFYNTNMALHNGQLDAVLFGKILTTDQKKCMVWDVERGAPDSIQDLPWQTCTCIGDWHYSKALYENNGYKSAKTVITTLIDVVSKNGNLLLNIPIRGDGSIDEKEIAILQGIADWMDINGESIFGTRPWTKFGEGPSVEASNPIKDQGFNEGKIIFSAQDIRFNQKANLVYATVMGVPDGNISIKSLNNRYKIEKIELLGSDEKIEWQQTDDQLLIEKPVSIPNSIALVFKVFL